MKKYRSAIAYELYCRFDGLVKSVKDMNTALPAGTPIRFKPLFISYNSCMESFQRDFPVEYQSLGLEPLPLENEEGKKLFTAEKLSTLLHQSEAVLSLLKGLSPYEFKVGPTSTRESLSWYWHNTHPRIVIYLLGLIFLSFLAGLIVADTSLYKNTIKPFILEYRTHAFQADVFRGQFTQFKIIGEVCLYSPPVLTHIHEFTSA